MPHTFQKDIAGKTLTIETGHLAQQAGGAVTLRYGDTVLLATACMAPTTRPDVDFLPLTIDYEERLYAAGKIPGSFFRREGRPTTEAVLTMRLTDRPLRPLFPKGLHNEIQVILTVLSADQENDPDILAILGASVALTISEIPFHGPVGACRVGFVDGQYLINPTFSQLLDSKLDLVVAGSKDAVIMIEAGTKEVSEEVLLEAIARGQEVNKQIIEFQEEAARVSGKPKVAIRAQENQSEAMVQEVTALVGDKVKQALAAPAKAQRDQALDKLQRETVERLGTRYAIDRLQASFQDLLRAEVRNRVLAEGIRPDGRALTQIRPISCQVGVLPRTHGSGLFTRGETQVLTITTLGSVGEEQRLDGLTLEESKRFIHHYNFPPFSTGEVKRIGSPSRREVGHGALAERALEPVIPNEEDFPYTIRLVSEVLSSNGSTSMASVCAGTLSLMDAGVPIKKPVAGAAMGLIWDQGRFAVLTDIAGMEDHLGDMDFKVAGTADGVTALQLDIKVPGIGLDIISQALKQAKAARLEILDKLTATISQSRPQVSKYAPKFVRITINPEKIGAVIGPGGKTIRSIIEQTKASIEVEDDGTVYVGSASEESIQRAVTIIQNLTKEIEVGTVFTGKVTRIASFGAFVELLPNKEGLVRTSELADHPVQNVEDVVKVGDEVMVMVMEIDRLGRINLSRRAVYEGPSSSREPRPMEPSLPRRFDARRPEPRPGPRPGGFGAPRAPGRFGPPSGPGGPRERRP